MSNLIGMDSGEIRSLANRIRNQAQALQSLVGRIDAVVHQIGQSWHGADATEFIGWWQQKHRPALLSAQAALAGLAQSADSNAVQQDQASGGGGGGRVAQSALLPASVVSGVAAVSAFSSKWGFAAGPILADLPKAGGPIDGVMQADSDFRLGQDLGEHHYQEAYNQASDMGADALMSKKTPVTVVAGVDLIILKHDVQAERAVNWSEVYQHPGELDPFAPGALKAVANAEGEGFKSLGIDLFQHSVGALLTR